MYILRLANEKINPKPATITIIIVIESWDHGIFLPQILENAKRILKTSLTLEREFLVSLKFPDLIGVFVRCLHCTCVKNSHRFRSFILQSEVHVECRQDGCGFIKICV